MPPDPRRVLVADPCGRSNTRLVAAASRAGGIGVLDVAVADSLTSVAADLDGRGVARWWLRPDARTEPDDVRRAGLAPSMVVLSPTGHDAASFARLVDDWAAVGGDVTAQVVSRTEGEVAKAAGVAGLIASGSEAGGRIGDTEAFILFQHLVDLGVPVWVRGGIGLHTAAAVIAGGGAGVLLDAQLGLLREADVGVDLRRALEAMDGSETRVVGNHRFFTRPDLPAAAVPDDTGEAEIASFLGADPRTSLVPIGQDGGFASGLAARFATVGGVVQAVQGAIDDHLAAAAATPPLAEGRGVAGPHGTRYPIAQGPMTRVSDRAEFAAAVADGGGLRSSPSPCCAAPRCATCSSRPRSSSVTGPGASASWASCPPSSGPNSSRSCTRWRPRTPSSPAAGRARPRPSRRPASTPTSTSPHPDCWTAS
ncbi:hypothetical protein ACE2AJ_10190 [Aquihabitans daechungensis]|uniref:hypothetical protein n=1 Tax=Aquihabitans daechungensis TaxID=1052257 RepID=UPI003BA16816